MFLSFFFVFFSNADVDINGSYRSFGLPSNRPLFQVFFFVECSYILLMLLLFVFFYHMTIALWQAIKKEGERGKSQGVPVLFSRRSLPHFLCEDTNGDIKAMITLLRIALTL